MSYEFTKLSDVPVVAEFPEGANAVIETNGEIKRCPSSGGGGGGIALITIAESGETFVASKNSEEIAATIDSGKLPILVIPKEMASASLGAATELYGMPFARDASKMLNTAGFAFQVSGAFAVVSSTGTVILAGP